MSLANSSEGWLRPEDVALHQIFPAANELAHSSLNDFFHDELYESVNSDVGLIKDEVEDTRELFGVSLYDSSDPYDHADVKSRQSQPPSPQPWRKGVWTLNKSTSPLRIGKTRKTQDAPILNISPAHLVAHDDLVAARSCYTKSTPPDRLRFSHCPTPLNQQRLDGDMNLSPSPMYSKPFHSDKNGFVEQWQQDFDGFNLGFDDDTSQVFTTNGGGHLAQSNVTYGQPKRLLEPRGRPMEGIRAATVYQMNHPGNSGHHAQRASRELSSVMKSNYEAANCNMFLGTPDQTDQTYRFINEDLQPMSDWTASGSLHSSNSSSNSHFSSTSSTENHQQAIYHTIPPQQTWWSPPLPSAEAQIFPAACNDHAVLYQPKPRRATHHVLNPDYTVDDGLGIRYPNSEEIGVAVPYYSPGSQNQAVQPTPVKQRNHRTYYSNTLSSYPQLPPPTHDSNHESPLTTPRRRTNATSRSPSPSVSPTRGMSRSRNAAQRSPTRRDPSQHRRKSIHKPGPKTIDTPRQRSLSRTPRTPRASRAPGDSQSQVGFVNFTPKDASKLLNDVAPSGSSKTRARRELEAREVRKKVAQVAIACVRDAGGDLAALERALVHEHVS